MAKADWTLPVTRVVKPWGHEEWFAVAPDQYCGKVLVIRAGHALSLQYHEEKDETIFVQSGVLRLDVGPSVDELETFELYAGESVRVRPGVVHRMTAVDDCMVLEASTTQLTDVVRLEDRYGRAPETADLAHR